MVEIYLESELVKMHVKGIKGQRITDWNDYPPEKSAFFQRNPDWCRAQAARIGTATGQAVTALLQEHALHNLRQCQGIIRLAEKYGQARLELACARANAFGDPRYRTVKNILERNLDQELLLFEPARDSSAFLHGSEELFSLI